MMDAQGGVTDASLLNVFNSRDGGKYKNVNSNSYLDQTDPDDQEYATTADLATPVDMKLPQLGRTQVIPLHNGPFENSGVTPALNQDSSIASIGSQNSSSAAAGVAQVGTAATDYESAITARNNAIAAQNGSASFCVEPLRLDEKEASAVF
jgi:hypothetical protein